MSTPFFLRLFGTPRLDGPAGFSMGSDAPRRLALLAVVAAAGPAGLSRDRVLGLLWGDRDQERARHALSQLSYGLRRDLGHPNLLGGRGALVLDAATVWSDLEALRAAAAAGDAAGVAAAYGGPLLDGFFLDDAPEFEHWLDAERARWARVAADALETLARRAPPDEAPAAWERLLAHDPLGERAMVGLLEALEAAGERPAALQAAAAFEARLARELEAPLPPRVRVVLERLRRTTPAAGRLRAADLLGAAPVPQPVVRDSTAAPPPAPPPAARASPVLTTAPPPPTPPPWRPSGWLLGLLAVAMPLAAAWVFMRPANVTLQEHDLLVVADLENATGDSTFDRSLATVLSIALRESPRVQLLQGSALREAQRRLARPIGDGAFTAELAREVAMREGARFVVSGEVSGDPARPQLTLRLEAPRSGRVLRRHVAEVERNRVSETVGQLAAALRRDLGDAAADPDVPSPLPRATTASLEALQAYASGIRLFGGGQYAAAEQAFSRAVAVDSNFVMALVSLGASKAWRNAPIEAEPLFARAERRFDRLPERERGVAAGVIARWRGDFGASVVQWQAHLERWPGDADVWAAQAYDLMRLRRAPEAIASYRRAEALRPLSAGDLINLATLELQRDAPDSAARRWAQAFARDSAFRDNPSQALEYARVLLMLGHADSARWALERPLHRGGGTKAQALRNLGWLDTWEGRTAEAMTRFRDAAALAAREQSHTSEARALLALAHLQRMLGLPDSARTTLRQLGLVLRRAPLEAQVLHWTGVLAADLGDRGLLAWLPDSARARTRAENRAGQAAIEALLGERAYLAGRTAEAAAHVRLAMLADSTTFVVLELARLEMAAGDTASATARWRAVADLGALEFGWEAQPWAMEARRRLAQLPGQRR